MLRRAKSQLADDTGFATIAGAGVIAGLTFLLVGMLYLGAATIARHRAQNAADLGALAAAQWHVRGEVDPCARARLFIVKQEGSPELVDCRIDGQDVLVQVRVPVHLGRFGVAAATARARAGP